MWRLDGSQATLQSGSLAVTLDLQQPGAGVAVCCTPSDAQSPLPATAVGRLWRMRLPGTTAPTAVSDAWVRGNDLVAVYGATASHASRAEVYWRLVSDQPCRAIGLELVVSIQTELLDDNPATCTESEICGTELWWLGASQPIKPAASVALEESGTKLGHTGPGACLVRLPTRVCYLEMVHPSDFGAVKVIRRGEGVVLRTELFEERLEKGVIRRGRIRGWLLPADGDLAAAERLQRDFAHSEPPLTV